MRQTVKELSEALVELSELRLALLELKRYTVRHPDYVRLQAYELAERLCWAQLLVSDDSLCATLSRLASNLTAVSDTLLACPQAFDCYAYGAAYELTLISDKIQHAYTRLAADRDQ